MKQYIFVLEDKISESTSYYTTKADNEKEAVICLFEYSGGSNIFTQERFNALSDSFDVFELIRLYENEHEHCVQFGEFNAIYGKPI